MKNIIIIGSSGHAKVVIDIIEKENKYNIIGLIDAFRPIGDTVFDYKVLGVENDLVRLTAEYKLYGCIIAIGDNWVRNIVSNKIIELELQLEFINTIHPSAVFGRDVSIGKGTVVAANSMIGSSTKIGDFCIIGTTSSIGHDGEMGNFSSVAPGVNTGGNVSIGKCSALSLGAKVIHNITIGEHSVIGAGSLVLKNIDKYTVEYGVPSKYIRKRKEGDKYV